MYVKKRYSFWMTLNWSKWPFIYGTLYALLVCLLVHFLELPLYLPWAPISVLGIAVAFYLGFKNNSSYDRTWEARKIWGSIVNNSRAFAAALLSFVEGENEKAIVKELVYRHIAWMTCLRHQLRLTRTWEHKEDRLTTLYSPTVCEGYHEKLDMELEALLTKEEIQAINGTSNAATQILAIQAKRLKEIKNQGLIEDFRHMELQQFITNLYGDQGKSERIKNFPFPRQYASVAIWITVVFCIAMPFGILDILKDYPLPYLVIAPFLSGLLTWVFFLMEKIGDYSENPFEGTYNDVPITAISRGIEIDLREMIEDENIPKPIVPENGFLM